MRALLARDVRMLAPYWWLIIPGHLLFAANGTLGPELLFWINVVLTLLYTVCLAVIDWRFEADRFVAALPTDRSNIVRARFAGAVAAGAVGTGLWVGYASILARVFPDRLGWTEQAFMWTTAEGIGVFFVLAMGLSVVFLPFVFSFGLGRGVSAFVAAVVVVSAAAVGWLVGAVEPAGALPSQALREGLASVISDVGPVLGWSAVLAVLVAFTWASMRVSVLGYDRRDL
jgi:hypothetical protein